MYPQVHIGDEVFHPRNSYLHQKAEAFESLDRYSSTRDRCLLNTSVSVLMNTW